MDRLSSCYFCGAALDATLEERPVVPSTFQPSTDSQKTVVLCVTCQRKLDAVLGTVLDAVEADAGDVAPDASADADRTADDRSDGSAATADESPATGDDLESTLGDDEDILTPVGEGDAAGEASDDDSEADAKDDSTDDRSKKSKYTDSRGAGFRREDDGPVDSGSLTGGAFSDDDDDESEEGSLTGDAFADDESGSGGRSTGDGQSSGAAGDGSESAGGSGSASAGDGGTGSTGGSASAGGSTGDDASGRERDVSMTRLENTKVMRLLENREFPVDRDEFVTVAANAYQVSRDDCDRVIDLAVEHGLLREENGQLYDGDA